MKVGMIFESGPEGAEKQVCEYLARRINPNIQIESVTHHNKPEMLADCGKAVAQLVKEGCERILIIWDLFPPWRGGGARPCRKKDRETILKSLKQVAMNKAPVFLICIQEELEAWLLADGRAISVFLSTTAHMVRVPNHKKPDRLSNPKALMKRIFQKNRRAPYNDLLHAVKIIQKVPDFQLIRRSQSFRRFEEKLC